MGEVQLEVLLARLKREFGCEVKAGSPEVHWQERLCRNVGPVENTFQLGPHKISIKLSATPLDSDAHDIRLSAEFLETAPREILAGVRSALLESTEVGILGKGPLVGVRFEVHEFTWTEGALPPMIKKACADGVMKLIKPADVQLYEPVMELSLAHTGPRPSAPSPKLHTTSPPLRVTFRYSAAPAAIPAEPPTMALFG